MRRVWWGSLLLGCLFAAASTAYAREDVGRYWNDANAALKRGAYREALQSLEVILKITPDDPWAQLYRSLCELRLQSTTSLPQLSASEWTAMSERLRQEERAQRHAQAQEKSLERRVRQEQLRWDRELETLERQAKRDAARGVTEPQATAVGRAQLEEAQRREMAQADAMKRMQLVQAVERGSYPAPSPAASSSAAPVPLASESSVELPKVVVPQIAAGANEPDARIPSLAGRVQPPKGAVQINAKQMSLSPDRRIALADDDVEVVFDNALLTCDHLTLFTDTKDAYAEGHVRLEDGHQVFHGEMVHYNFKTKKGRFLQGTISSPPWHEHGRSVEQLAEGVSVVTPGYITSCELDPPHFKFYGRRATVFSADRLAHLQNAALFVQQIPFIYLPWLSIEDRQSPFFIIPGKKKPWGEFALMGYRYQLPGPANQRGTIRLDWRRLFEWGMGVDHQFDSPQWGRGLLKVYYNQVPNRGKKKEERPKGAGHDRYRVLWRHSWKPLPDTTMVTDIQKYSDADFRQELLYREEFSRDDTPQSFISIVKNDPHFTLSGLVRKRVNRFQTVDNALPQVTLDVRQQRVGETQLFTETKFDVANFETKRAHSDNDTDVIRADWFHRLSYAMNLFHPIEITPNVGVRQTFYTKDIQGSDREGQRNLFSGQGSMGVDASLKLFRTYPVISNVLGLNLDRLRHVITPTIGYAYVHRPTVPNALLNFAAAGGASNQVAFGVENKLQTKRPWTDGKLKSVDLGRLLVSLPYSFRGTGNKQGGRLGDWSADLETYPWPWLRLETDVPIPSHFPKNQRDDRIQRWNLDLVMVGGHGSPQAQYAPGIQAPVYHAFEPGSHPVPTLIPQGQWYVGLGHRYSQNDKTEDVLECDWRLSPKWQIGTFHRFTWKEVASLPAGGTTKRFNNMREYQYTLRRDLHDWIGELVYRVDREYGEELFLTLTLKAYPEMPIGISDSYHEPKFGSQSSPFSPIRMQ